MIPPSAKAHLQSVLEHARDLRALTPIGGGSSRKAVDAFLSDLASLSHRIEIRRRDKDAADRDGIRIGDRVRFIGIPEGRELPPFLSLMAPSGPLPGEALELPATLTLFIGPHCPHCPVVFSRMVSLTTSSQVSLTIVDVEAHPDLAEARGVQSVPTLILDGAETDSEMRWTGAVSAREIWQVMGHRDPSRMGRESLSNLIENGEAGRLAEMMREADAIFPAFPSLLLDEKWSVRLGAMVCAESLMEGGLGTLLVEILWAQMGAVSDTVKGDILYLAGLTEDPRWIPLIRELETGASAALQEAIEEALETLQEG